MKTFIPFTIAAALVASGLANAQAFSKPSGYVTQDLAANQFNLVGIALHGSPVASGALDTVAGNALTDNDFAFSPEAGKTYVLEILTGSIAGTVQAIPAANIVGTTITTPDDLGSMGLVSTDTYSLRLAPTLEEIFGTDSNSVLSRSLSSNTADIVWIPDRAGSYDKYFVHITGAFRFAGTTTLAPNVPVVYSDGILVQKRGTASSLVLTGEVKTKGTNSVASQGFNLISVVAPAGLTLFTSGLADDLAVSLSQNTADIVWLPQAGGTYNKYFRHISGNWRNVSAPTVNVTVDVDLPSAIWIQRKSASAANITLDVPTTYGNL